jgi:predicted DNA-binding mobile mystery protein A
VCIDAIITRLLRLWTQELMTKPLTKLDINLLDEVVEPLAGLAARPRPVGGWAKAVREAFGMTRAQLATRTGISPSTVNTLERSEAQGTVTIESLEKLAAGLGGKLVYAIVPPPGKTFEQLVLDRAEKLAKKRLARVSHTMSLEDQAVEKRHQERQLRRVVESLLAGSRRTLWR